MAGISGKKIEIKWDNRQLIITSNNPEALLHVLNENAQIVLADDHEEQVKQGKQMLTVEDRNLTTDFGLAAVEALYHK